MPAKACGDERIKMEMQRTTGPLPLQVLMESPELASQQAAKPVLCCRFPLVPSMIVTGEGPGGS